MQIEDRDREREPAQDLPSNEAEPLRRDALPVEEAAACSDAGGLAPLEDRDTEVNEPSDEDEEVTLVSHLSAYRAALEAAERAEMAQRAVEGHNLAPEQEANSGSSAPLHEALTEPITLPRLDVAAELAEAMKGQSSAMAEVGASPSAPQGGLVLPIEMGSGIALPSPLVAPFEAPATDEGAASTSTADDASTSSTEPRSAGAETVTVSSLAPTSYETDEQPRTLPPDVTRQDVAAPPRPARQPLPRIPRTAVLVALLAGVGAFWVGARGGGPLSSPLAPSPAAEIRPAAAPTAAPALAAETTVLAEPSVDPEPQAPVAARPEAPVAPVPRSPKGERPAAAKGAGEPSARFETSGGYLVPPRARRSAAEEDPVDPSTVAAVPEEPRRRGVFNPHAAANALAYVSPSLHACADPSIGRISTEASVTFAPSGHVTQATLRGLPTLLGSPMISCVIGKLRKAIVPEFSGENVTVHTTVTIE